MGKGYDMTSGKYIFMVPLLTLLSFSFISCSSVSSLVTGERVAIVPYSPSSLIHLQQGRTYVVEGRYELAKEQYLMALASSEGTGSAATITEELHAVDMMIKTQR